MAGEGGKLVARRELGNTGLKVSSLSFGGSPLGNLYGQIVREDDAIAAIHEAARLGINLFDVSPFVPYLFLLHWHTFLVASTFRSER